MAQTLKGADSRGTGIESTARGQMKSQTESLSGLQQAALRGDAYSMTNVTYDYDAADTILGVENVSTTRQFHVDHVVFSGSTASVVTMHVVTSDVTMAGTAVTPTNLNTRSGNSGSDLSVKADETGNTQGSKVWEGLMPAALSQTVHFGGSVILGASKMFGVDYVTDGTTAYVTIVGWFEDNA